jgi:hypothetical protein
LARHAVKRFLCGLLIVPLLTIQNGTCVPRAQRGTQTKGNPALLCVISTEAQDWTPAKPATIHVTVENLSNGPLDIPLWSLLYLSPVPQAGLRGTKARVSERIAASVNPTVFEGLDHPPGAVLVENGSARLRFGHKGQKANFKFDASDLIWDFEVVSRTPALKLFTAAKPGAYELQFHMYWEGNNTCDSSKLRLSIAGTQ